MARIVNEKERIKQNILGIAILGIHEATSRYSDAERTIKAVQSILYFTEESIKGLDWLEETEKKGIKEDQNEEKQQGRI